MTEGIWGGSDGKTGILHGKISDISGDDQSYFKLSQDSYLMVTDMQHNLTLFQKVLQNFWGFHRDGVKMDINSAGKERTPI